MKLNNYDYRFLKKLLQSTQHELLEFLPKALDAIYRKEDIIITNNYICAKGDIPVALVAHLDTVYPEPPKQIFHDPEYNIIWGTNGLGADDRAGVFAILNILECGYKPTVIFCCDEENGGLGAYQLTKDFPKPFTNFEMLIELDRQGTKDAVYYSLNNTNFENYINNYGFETAVGVFTDICILGPIWDVPAVNLSVGYFNEHSYAEMLYYPALFDTIDKVCLILEEKRTKDFEFTEITGSSN